MADLPVDDKHELIKAVRDRPFLWKKDSPGYKKRDLRQQAWEEIGKLFTPELDGKGAQRVWNQLRQGRSNVKVKLPSGSEAPSKKIKWEFWDSMRFLEETERKRSSASNFPASKDDTHDQSENGSPRTMETEAGFESQDPDAGHTEPNGTIPNQDTTTPANPRKKSAKSRPSRSTPSTSDALEQALLERLNNPPPEAKPEEDPDVAFGTYVATQLKKLSEAGKLRAINKIQSVLTESRLAELEGPPTPTNQAAPSHYYQSGFQGQRGYAHPHHPPYGHSPGHDHFPPPHPSNFYQVPPGGARYQQYQPTGPPMQDPSAAHRAQSSTLFAAQHGTPPAPVAQPSHHTPSPVPAMHQMRPATLAFSAPDESSTASAADASAKYY